MRIFVFKGDLVNLAGSSPCPRLAVCRVLLASLDPLEELDHLAPL